MNNELMVRTVRRRRSPAEAFLSELTSPRTAAAYRRDLELFFHALDLTDVVPTNIDADDLRQFRSELERRGDAPATIDRRLAVVGAFARRFGGEPGPTPRAHGTAPTPTLLGLEDVSTLIGAVSGPDEVAQGVAVLLFVSRSATVDEALAIGPSSVSDRLHVRIGDRTIVFPQSLRATLRALVKTSGDGPLFGGIGRQTLTRRLRHFGDGCRVSGCTPRTLRRSSDQVALEAMLWTTGRVTDPSTISVQERLDVICDAVRGQLT